MSEVSNVTRRDFLKSTAAAAAAAQVFAVLPSRAQTAGKKFKVGLIGCGGRGTGAMKDHLAAAKHLGIEIEVIAVADFFEDRAKGAAKSFGVPESNAFWGPTAYQKVATGPADIIVTAAPPGFRPVHFELCIKSGKHVFAEKPVAVDPPGIRRWLAAGEEATKKGLTVVAGTQRRHQEGYLKNYEMIKSGAIGRITAAQIYWCGTVPWVKNRNPGEDDGSYMAKNWLAFSAMCGDHIVEQHVHNLDVALWYIGRPPKSALGFGARTRRKTGDVYDFFSIDYDFDEDVHVHSMCRQISGTYGRVSEYFVGSEGAAPGSGRISRLDKKALTEPTIKVTDGNPYVEEHVALLTAIATGKPINAAQAVGEATAAAIMGRISAYTGQMVTWNDIMKKADSAFYNYKCGPQPEDFENGTAKAPKDDVAPLPGNA